jgi:hypothetical protein
VTRALLTIAQGGFVVIDIPDYGVAPAWPRRWPVVF